MNCGLYYWINFHSLKAVFRWSVVSESIRVSEKKSEAAKEKRMSQMRKSNYSQSVNSSVDRILSLQRIIGNQAVGSLIKSGALQAKLRIGQHDDIYEQEADRVAEQVMRTPEPRISEKSDCTGENTNIKRKCPKLEEYEKMRRKPLENVLKAQRGSTPEVTSELEEDINSINGKGQPLTESLRSFFEPRFGYDFSHVRLHTNNGADRLSHSVSAMAFTVGNDIVFSSGAYNPASNEGLHLLGHELTHTVQQTGGVQTKRFSQQPSLQTKYAICDSEELQRSLDILSTSKLIQRRVVCDELGENCQSVPDEEETTPVQPEENYTPADQNYTPAEQDYGYTPADQNYTSAEQGAGGAGGSPDFENEGSGGAEGGPGSEYIEPVEEYPPVEEAENEGDGWSGGAEGASGSEYDPCLDLLQQIIELLDEVARRFNNALDDKYNLFKYRPGVNPEYPDKGTWDGHRNRYKYDRDRLRHKIAEWDSNDDCRGYRLNREQQEEFNEAKEFGEKEFPEKPSRAMSEAFEGSKLDQSYMDKMAEITGLTGTALVLYLIASEGSRLFPPRNLVPVP